MNATLRSTSFNIALGSIVILTALFSFFALYRSSRYIPSLERLKQSVDAFSMNAYVTNNLIARVVNTYVYHNGDKYVFRPPRILPTVTIPGKPVYRHTGSGTV